MLLLAALVATTAWSYGFAQIYPVQSPISITKSQRSARMTCEIKTSEETFESMSIHWYQQKEGRAPERLLLFSEGRLSVETGFLARRYMVEKVSTQKRFILTIKDVIPDDAATYYCAYWDAHHDRNSKIITAKSPQQLNYRCHEMRGLWLLKESPSKSHQLQVRWSKDMAKHHGKEGKALVFTILCLHHSCHSFVVGEYDVAVQELSEWSVCHVGSQKNSDSQTKHAGFLITSSGDSSDAILDSKKPVHKGNASFSHWLVYKRLPAILDVTYLQVRGVPLWERAGPSPGDLLQRALDTSLMTRCESAIPDVLPADKGQAFTQSPGTDWEINGIFSSNSTAREHLSLLQSQNTVWSTWTKYFGMGTILIVSSKGNSPPANSEILQKEHENQITYVCLVEKFYPEVIRVTWTDEKNEEVTGNVVKGDTWKATENEEYSIGSWLTVPVENKDKKYYCKYEHESQERSLPTQEKDIDFSTKTASQEDDCNTSGNSTVFNRDHIIHRTAYLAYIILLLKSSMYYLIVLFFIFRMWAVTKHQGKKA
ncbi:T-cell receptor gamma alternate reading frame protein [Amazona ochrocephala]